MKEKNQKAIAVIEAGGTGKELASAFEIIVKAVCQKNKVGIPSFLSFENQYNYNPSTFWGIKDKFSDKPYKTLLKSIKKEETDLDSFLRFASKNNCLGVFRTAINAETLYQLRMRTKIIKAVEISIQGRKLLFVRDQIQGYYSNESVDSSLSNLKISNLFSNDNFNLICGFVKERLSNKNTRYDSVLFVYKYHILGLELEKMIDASCSKVKIGIPYRILQPDSGVHYLLHDWWKSNQKNIVVICGNEVGDVLLETLIHFYKLGTKETVFTNEYCLTHDNLEILQTMHGSADSISGQNSVNPIATIKAAAYASEKWLKIPGVINRIDKIIRKAAEDSFSSKDEGGNKTTTEIVGYILKHI